MPTTSCIFEGLNESQKMAVAAAEGPVLIVAGPGTGKTLTIVRRIAYLIQQGVKPETILAVTFTNRSAREMKERADALLGNNSGNIFIGTFHLLGLKIIKDALSDNFVLYNRDEQISLIKPLLKDTNIKPQEAIERISKVKNFLEDANDEIGKIYENYQSALIEKSALDFDDLILKPIEMLSNLHSNIPSKYKNRFNYIMVDEYQDINPAQYRLLRLLTPDTGNLCVIGDSDQAIYAFRGADMENFLDFEKDFKDTKRITLTENYRSTGIIVSASGAMIKNNLKRIDKKLHPIKERGTAITIISAPDDKAEGEIIVNEIEKRIGGTSHYQLYSSDLNKGEKTPTADSYAFSDFAVIYRTNAQARAIENAFLASGVPYQVIGRGISKQSREIEDTILYMKSVITPVGDISAHEQASLEEKLLTPSDIFDPRAEAVTLLTLHMAKGLEYRVVFIAGVEKGMIPYAIKKDNVDPVRSSYIKRECDLHGDLPVTEKASKEVDIEEERRLFYVGMTRAREKLFLIRARNRFLYGQRLTPEPSPFIREIPESLIESRFVPDRIKTKKEKQMGLF
ncbi:MAG: UvrD-helicase domain-containing protein [Nitrospirae bacterium]|nr:UvrD-helicase domain-containing protein [Nitrospirota bacterium]